MNENTYIQKARCTHTHTHTYDTAYKHIKENDKKQSR